jgi:rare lipoprotein A
MVVADGRHLARSLLCVCMSTMLYACFRAAVPRPVVSVPLTPGKTPYTFTGVASWYGPGFDGKRTATGEVYDQEQLTGASPTLPLGSYVLVTNLSNARTVQIRINDRGPFVKHRLLDLSHHAAVLLGMVGPGTARVRVTILREGVVLPPGYFVQVGSFSDEANATRVRLRLAEFYQDVEVDQIRAGRHRYYRVRMGAFPNHLEAMGRAHAAAKLGFPVIIVKQ